ncbi:MAG: GNAT family N-acetyltransferase [Lachnospiraceae bacterium]|nr:GNAT family N-acetyltransferase [Lachnospiraceae bacterium]
MKIRTAEASDVPKLLDIYNYEVLHGTATFDIHPKTLEERMVWFREHNVDNHPLIVAETEGQVAGYASLSPYREKEAYAATVELSVYVDAACRGKGTAAALLTEILNMARERPDIHTVISVITDGNEVSVHLHEKFGFLYCGTMHEVGEKFGRKLGIVNYQLMV